MIITEFYDGQGLGNQLWVYAAARSISEELDVPFVLLGADRFKGEGFLNIDSVVGISTLEALDVKNTETWKIFNEALFYDPELDYISSGFDSRVLALSGTNKINGLFQSEKYFFGNLERLSNYFILDRDFKTKNQVPEDTCIINLRGGEYKKHKNFILPDSYWKTAIENMKRISDVRKFLVVTDDVRYARAMFPGFDLLEGGIGDCYATIYNAKHLIVSNSSFAYFPAKTGLEKGAVIAPMYWARYSNTLGRWASACNVYEGWLWQDTFGKLHDFDTCFLVANETQAFYEQNYCVRTSMESVQRKKFKDYFPKGLRVQAKLLLSLIAPKHFG